MSKNRNRAKLDKANTGKEYHTIWLNILYPLYWDEGVHHYPKCRKGYKNPNKYLLKYQVRMCRTWKHNRKTQWKP